MKNYHVAILTVLFVVIVIGMWFLVKPQGESADPAKDQFEVQVKLDYTPIGFGHPLKCRSISDVQGGFIKPSPLKLPAHLREDRVVYFTINLDGQPIHMVGQPGDPPCLYVDTDGDNDLSEESGIRGVTIPRDRWRWYWDPNCFYGPVTVTIPNTESQRTVRFYVGSYGRNYISIYQAGFWRGALCLGQDEYYVGILDGDLNGALGYVSSPITSQYPSQNQDALIIDTNQDGEIDWESDNKYALEKQPLAEYIRLNDSYFKVQVAGDVSSLRLKKTELPMSTLAVNDKSLRFIAVGDNGLMLYCHSNSQYSIPAGNYRLTEFEAKKMNEQGICYTITQSDQSDLEVSLEPDQTEVCTIGPPFTLQAEVKVSSEGGWFSKKSKVVTITPQLLGQGGKTYDFGIDVQGRSLREPKVKIVDEKGEILSSGTFEFG